MRLYGIKLIFSIVGAFALSTLALAGIVLWLCPGIFSSIPAPREKKRDCDGKHEWIGGCLTMYACSKCGKTWEESEIRCKYCNVNVLKKDEWIIRKKHRCSRDEEIEPWEEWDKKR